jgi:hypothetical protein
VNSILAHSRIDYFSYRLRYVQVNRRAGEIMLYEKIDRTTLGGSAGELTGMLFLGAIGFAIGVY